MNTQQHCLSWRNHSAHFFLTSQTHLWLVCYSTWTNCASWFLHNGELQSATVLLSLASWTVCVLLWTLCFVEECGGGGLSPKVNSPHLIHSITSCEVPIWANCLQSNFIGPLVPFAQVCHIDWSWNSGHIQMHHKRGGMVHPYLNCVPAKTWIAPDLSEASSSLIQIPFCDSSMPLLSSGFPTIHYWM